MQTLIAYAYDREPEHGADEAGIGRVAEYYEPLWPVPVRRSGKHAGRVGLFLFDEAESAWRWPSWAEDGEMSAATLYLPLGYERIVGDLEPESAALPLARVLATRMDSVLELTAPFVVASLSRSRLSLHTDGIGLGRLFELRFPGGWVWSNRPIAACRFAGLRAVADRTGWRHFAAGGWFMGDSTPLEGVRAVTGGTRIEYDAEGAGRVSTRIDVLTAWAANQSGDVLSAERVEQCAEALRGFGRSLARMRPGVVAAGLSGGRDSRLVVASMLAAGVPLRVVTNGAEGGEADVAERLIGRLPAARRPEHVVNRPAAGGTGQVGAVAEEAAMLPNVLAWHRAQEGLRPATSLPNGAPSGLTRADFIGLSGAAGEIARGYYYPADYQEIARLPRNARLEAYAARLSKRAIRRPGIAPAALQAAEAQIHEVLRTAMAAGLDDAKMLDYFFVDERVRRWGTTQERCGTVLPLLVPEFVQAGFDLTPEQRQADALHEAVIARLVPEWSGEGYYKPPTGLVQPLLLPRLGLAPDRDRITAVVTSPSSWADAYDEGAVAVAWRRLLDGDGDYNDEQLMQRVLWRAGYEDFLAEANQESVSAPVPTIALPAPSHRRNGPVVKVRRATARALRKAAAAAAP